MKQKLNRSEQYHGRKRRGKLGEKFVMSLMLLCIEIVCVSVMVFMYFEVENLVLDSCDVEGSGDFHISVLKFKNRGCGEIGKLAIKMLNFDEI